MNLINLKDNLSIGYEIVFNKNYKSYFLNMDLIEKDTREKYTAYIDKYRNAYFIKSVKRQSNKAYNECLEIALNNLHIFKSAFIDDLLKLGFIKNEQI